MERQLQDRVESYQALIYGACRCGQEIIKVIGSNCTCWVNGDRYHYIGDNTASCIFRCKNCGQPIHKTFSELPF